VALGGSLGAGPGQVSWQHAVSMRPGPELSGPSLRPVLSSHSSSCCCCWCSCWKPPSLCFSLPTLTRYGCHSLQEPGLWAATLQMDSGPPGTSDSSLNSPTATGDLFFFFFLGVGGGKDNGCFVALGGWTVPCPEYAMSQASLSPPCPQVSHSHSCLPLCLAGQAH
jgi:hypothetical protein